MGKSFLKFSNPFFVILFVIVASAPNLAHASFEKAELQEMIQKIRTEFVQDISRKGLSFSIQIAWNRNSVNAFSKAGLWKPKKRTITVNGGVAKGALSKDGALWLLCHEFGHHFAGAPYAIDFEGILSAEGQADYWASQVCMPRLFKNAFSNVENPISADSQTYGLCEEKFAAEEDRQVCARTLDAALEFQTVALALDRPSSTDQLSYSTPDQREVRGTILGYPSHQCRVDTALAAVLDQRPPACWYRSYRN